MQPNRMVQAFEDLTGCVNLAFKFFSFRWKMINIISRIQNVYCYFAPLPFLFPAAGSVMFNIILDPKSRINYHDHHRPLPCLFCWNRSTLPSVNLLYELTISMYVVWKVLFWGCRRQHFLPCVCCFICNILK